MKKYIIVLFALLSLSVFGQSSSTNVVDFGTISNAITTTRYFYFGNWTKVDSISVTLVDKGANINVDSVNFYVGVSIPGTAYTGSGSSFSATAITQISTLAAVGMQQLYTDNASPLSGANLRGANIVKITMAGSPTGNAASNKTYLLLKIWGTK